MLFFPGSDAIVSLRCTLLEEVHSGRLYQDLDKSYLVHGILSGETKGNQNYFK